jgi:RimJ/RimL family protein N-acetyltransferase
MLSGKRVTLRAMRREDLESYNALRNDLEIALLARDSPPAPEEMERTLADFDEHLKRDPREHPWFAIEADGKFIGQCLLRNFDHTSRTCELGISIGDRAYLGHGYGREAVELLVDFAFRLSNMGKVWLTLSAANERARRSYAACGFVEEGRLRRHIWVGGAYDDLVYMGILRNEWATRMQSTTPPGPPTIER